MRALIGLGGWRELKLETEYRFLFNGKKKYEGYKALSTWKETEKEIENKWYAAAHSVGITMT